MEVTMSDAHGRETTLDLLQYIAASPTAAHAIETTRGRLDAAGFVELLEADRWKLSAGDRFYVIRGHHALVAGVIGDAPPAEAGFRLAGAHTDAPGLRLKPNAHYAEKGYLQMGVEIYGGPLLGTWTDRDLTLAGKLFLRQPGAPPRVRLVRLERPVCRIPQVAIHFNREVNTKGLILDKQKHLPPIYGLGDEDALEAEPLLQFVAQEAQVAREEIVAADLEVIDTQPPVLGGLREELYFAPHIDNLAGSHAILESLRHSTDGLPFTRAIALFDSEEIGSQTSAGAGSFFLDAVLERITSATDASREAWHRARARSVLISVDGAHAIHPNYADVHDPHHQPHLNAGPVIKVNAQQRYATTPRSGHWFEHCADRAGVPLQYYVQRTDLPCGSTIGPMTATRLGVPTIDVGNPMLSMHSIRETGGAEDQAMMIKILTEHFTAEERR